MRNTISIVTIAAVVAVFTGSVSTSRVYAQDPPAEPKKGWETTAAAGLTLTSGNSETFLATITLDTKRKWEKHEVLAGVGFGYGESEFTDDLGNTDNQKTTDFGLAYGQYNRLFSERLYGGVRVDAGYDDIAGVEYRVRVSPILGYYLIKKPKTSLAVEAGPSFVWESLEGQDADSYVAARFVERFEHKLTEATKIWQSLEYLPEIENWADNYLLLLEAGIDTAITKKISLRVVLQDTYDSDPAPGREENDLRLIAGIAYKF